MDMIAFAALSRFIRPDERIVWTGRPDPWAFASAQAGGLAAVGAAFLIGLLAAAVIAIDAAANNRLMVDLWFCVGFGLAGAVLSVTLLLAPWRAYHRAMRTVYGLTTERALILTTGPSRSLQALPHSAIRAVLTRRTGRDTVDLTFCPQANPGEGAAPAVGFRAIRDVEAAERLARRLKFIERAG